MCTISKFFILSSFVRNYSPTLKHKCSHRMELKEPISFSQKYDIDLRLFLKK